MIQPHGYEVLDSLGRVEGGALYSAVQTTGQKPVVIKHAQDTTGGGDGLYREFQIGRKFRHPNVLRHYAIEQYFDGPLLILEHFSSVSLEKFLKRGPIEIRAFLKIAIGVAKGLGAVHQKRVIHKNIKPSNVLVEPKSLDVKICDFSLAAMSGTLEAEAPSSNVPGADLAYISPEQTGRMGAGTDYRSDLYSLGVVFYEALTGNLPFMAEDPMEMVHFHLARPPISPKDLEPAIPRVISDMILKLLSKKPKDRYQSCHGLCRDLERCSLELESAGNIRSFPLGEKDFFREPKFPEKLFGREKEISDILDAFEQLKAQGVSMVMVGGAAGVGKTALINEIRRLLGERDAIFISGKFDQLQQGVPYSAISDAFDLWVRRLLASPKDEIEQWRQRLEENFGQNLQLLVEIIPKMEKIVGKQPPLAKLGLMEEQNRFKMLLQNFFRAVSRPDHPLVLFLDDLQWADRASLNLLEMCRNDSTLKGLLIMGAYREEEARKSESLGEFLRKAENMEAGFVNISLSPFSAEEVAEFTALATNQRIAEAAPLGAFLYEKSRGNPFAVIEFVKWLHAREYLELDPNTGAWTWKASESRMHDIPASIADLLTKRLEDLPSAMRQVLSTASCIGHEFEADLLVSLSSGSSVYPRDALNLFVKESFILPVAADSRSKELLEGDPEQSTFRFSHDKIHDAAYYRSDESRRMSIHFKIGETLLKKRKQNDSDEHLFEIVNHFNLSGDLIEQSELKATFSELCLQAAWKAHKSGALRLAFSYVADGLHVLGDSGWGRHRDVTMALHVQGVKSAYLCGETGAMEAWGKAVEENSDDIVEKAEIYEVQIQSLLCDNKLSEALDLAVGVLHKLDVKLPRAPGKIHTLFAAIRALLLLGGRKPEKYMELPEIRDPKALAASRVLYHAMTPAYFSASALFPHILFKLAEISVKKGNSIYSALGFGGSGLIFGGALGLMETGFRYGILAIRLIEAQQSSLAKPAVYFSVNHFIRHWKEPLIDCLPDLVKACRLSLEIGDFEYSAYCAQACSGYSFKSGMPLDKTIQEMKFYSAHIDRLKHETAQYVNDIFYQTALNLVSGIGTRPAELSGEVYDERKSYPVHRAGGDMTCIFCLHLEKLFMGLLFDDIEHAEEWADVCRENIMAVIGTFYVPLSYFYEGLLYLRLCDGAKGRKRRKYLKKAVASRKKLKKWARLCPQNHRNKILLIDAELAKEKSKKERAAELYDLSIRSAEENGFVHEAAMAAEFAFRFHLSISRTAVARAYLLEAVNAYERWGAHRKADALLDRHGDLLEGAMLEGTAQRAGAFEKTGRRLVRPDVASAGAKFGTGFPALLDVFTVIKASQAMSGEVELDKFLDRMMIIICENAGARKGVLITIEGEDLFVEAVTNIDRKFVEAAGMLALDDYDNLPRSVVRYAARTGESVVLPSKTYRRLFENDRYLRERNPASILCTPVSVKEKNIGVLYLENDIVENAFTEERLNVLQVLLSQAAISLENAKFFTEINDLNRKLQREAKEKDRAEKALKESRERLRTILDHVQAGIVIVDIEHLEIADANPAALEMVAAPKEGVIGARAAEFFDIDSLSFSAERSRAGFSSNNVESRLFTANKDELPIIQTVTPIVLNDRLHYLVSFIDIKKLKDAEKERTLLQNQLQHSQKIEAIGTLAGGVAHDFNNILTSILGFTELSIEDVEEGSILRDNLVEVKKAGLRAKELVNQILTFARQSDIEKKPVRMSSIVKETIKFLRSSLPSTIAIKSEIGSEENVLADPTQIHQILMNLCTNAHHAMRDKGGVLKIVLRELIPDETLAELQELRASSRFLELSVQDDGCGMTPDIRERVFDPYFTTKEKGSGTGLGLSVVRGIVNGCGGAIKVESAPGKGSRFLVYLPVIEKFLESEIEANVVVPGGTESILFVDDEPTILAMGRQMLRRLGYEVTTRSSSLEALKLFEAKPEAFDLVLADLTMPNMTGDKMAQKMLAIRPDIPVIICTGYSEKASRHMVENIGIKAIKLKPLVRSELAISIREALNGNT